MKFYWMKHFILYIRIFIIAVLSLLLFSILVPISPLENNKTNNSSDNLHNKNSFELNKSIFDLYVNNNLMNFSGKIDKMMKSMEKRKQRNILDMNILSFKSSKNNTSIFNKKSENGIYKNFYYPEQPVYNSFVNSVMYDEILALDLNLTSENYYIQEKFFILDKLVASEINFDTSKEIYIQLDNLSNYILKSNSLVDYAEKYKKYYYYKNILNNTNINNIITSDNFIHKLYNYEKKNNITFEDMKKFNSEIPFDITAMHSYDWLIFEIKKIKFEIKCIEMLFDTLSITRNLLNYLKIEGCCRSHSFEFIDKKKNGTEEIKTDLISC